MGNGRHRIAITCGRLEVPPNYFVLQPAELLYGRYAFRAFGQRVRLKDVKAHTAYSDVPTRSLSALEMTRELSAWKPAIIHQHWATWCAPAVMSAKRLNVSLLISVHGYDAFLPRAAGTTARMTDPIKRVERWLGLRNAYRLIVNSRYMESRLHELGVDPGRVTLIPHAVDTDFFAPSQATPRSGVLFLGRLSAEKGCSLLIEALSKLKPESYGHLRIAGGGPLLKDLRRQADEQSVPASFSGPLDRDQVRRELQRARLVVVPSIPRGLQQEASGIAPLEAQACGTPVVVTAVGGLQESVAPATADLAAFPRADSLAASIEEALTRDFDEISAAVVEHVQRQHSLSQLAHRFDALYSKAITGG